LEEFSPRSPGVAVFPLLSNGKIVLHLNFRHATRSWELELPRGMIQENELPTDAALRELREGAGLEITAPIYRIYRLRYRDIKFGYLCLFRKSF